jgi:hypothetical protein
MSRRRGSRRADAASVSTLSVDSVHGVVNQQIKRVVGPTDKEQLEVAESGAASRTATGPVLGGRVTITCALRSDRQMALA